MRLFFFGLLRDEDMREVVLGRSLPRRHFRAAHLCDARLVTLRNETYPVLVPAPGQRVPGVVAEGLAEPDIDRIVFFESVEYALTAVTVELAGGDVLEAQIFTMTERAGVLDEPWRFKDWQDRHKARDLHQARLWMALHGHLAFAEADRLWDEALAAGRTIEDLVEQVCGKPRA